MRRRTTWPMSVECPIPKNSCQHRRRPKICWTGSLSPAAIVFLPTRTAIRQRLIPRLKSALHTPVGYILQLAARLEVLLALCTGPVHHGRNARRVRRSACRFQTRRPSGIAAMVQPSGHTLVHGIMDGLYWVVIPPSCPRPPTRTAASLPVPASPSGKCSQWFLDELLCEHCAA
jgi:hypothetical protein